MGFKFLKSSQIIHTRNRTKNCPIAEKLNTANLVKKLLAHKKASSVKDFGSKYFYGKKKKKVSDSLHSKFVIAPKKSLKVSQLSSVEETENSQEIKWTQYEK